MAYNLPLVVICLIVDVEIALLQPIPFSFIYCTHGLEEKENTTGEWDGGKIGDKNK